MPTYRDERDALRNQVETLSQDLESARADAEKAKHVGELEERLAEAQRSLQAMQSELERLRGRQGPRRSQGVVVAASAGIVFAAGLAGALIFLRSAPQPPQPIVVTTPPVPPAVAQPVPHPATAAPPEPPPAAVEHRAVTWKASVQKATGIAASGVCRVDADLTGSNEDLHVASVVVTCGSTKLYDSNDKLEGMSMLSSGADLTQGSYVLRYSDKGTRSGKSQVGIDTAKRAASVWSEDVPAFRVDLTIVPEGKPIAK